ncbi:MAG: hypothetical protein J6V30_06490 [Paludibacteraceae bacterium]|nr:hypothetical protein [Paludibacteraceae bacterium]
MKVSEVKTAFKIADVEWDGKGTKLNFKYLTNIKDENGNPLSQNILTENVARVYLIVVDGEIYKIGGSQANGGMKQTLYIYQDGGVNGRPSIRSFGVWYFLFHTITQNHKIEFYMIYQENFEAQIKGLLGLHIVENASLSYKLLEECCIADYKMKENGNYPQWNIQEQGADWPLEIKNEHSEITQKSLSKTSKRKQISIVSNPETYIESNPKIYI